ncbi:hypothetical protein ABZW18_30110 [Streptomyces sp. NPDC004647]|uniref:hypothetical protein n=1 Tax=Streptomyces sp. NPDC004647 TaxID=3154671 RepID=UPI0033A0977B
MSARLSERGRLSAQREHARKEALTGLGTFAALVVDANPALIATGELREYGSPSEAVTGLYERWLTAREPLMLLWVSHPSPEVRDLAFSVQAQLELVLRRTAKALERQAELPGASYNKVLVDMTALGQSLSPRALGAREPRMTSG